MKCNEDTESAGCRALALERIRYFTGRHMTARDFDDGDAYHRSFRHLHNRILHGWGIACGLEVVPHPKDECRPDRVVVRCGLAIDCCGREIVVPRDVVPTAIEWDARPTSNGKPSDAYVLLLALTYSETPTEKVPVLYSPDACSAPSMEFGRVRECFRLSWHWVLRDELEAWGWTSPANCDTETEQATEHHRHGHDCDCRERRGCLEPDCPEKNVVPLAVIDVDDRAHFDPSKHIDRRGRRTVVRGHEQLTRICGINWVHGGLMKVSELSALKVRFEGPILHAEHRRRPGPRGINERTFIVQYGEQLKGQQVEDLDFVEFRHPPHLSGDHRTAIYEIRNPATYRNHVVHVTLRCDFILDCHRRPVDGDHLAGELPTGNGVPGGTFESWFHVVDDDDYDRLMQESEEHES